MGGFNKRSIPESDLDYGTGKGSANEARATLKCGGGSWDGQSPAPGVACYRRNQRVRIGAICPLSLIWRGTFQTWFKSPALDGWHPLEASGFGIAFSSNMVKASPRNG